MTKLTLTNDEAVQQAFATHVWVTEDGRTLTNPVLLAYEKGKSDAAKEVLSSMFEQKRT